MSTYSPAEWPDSHVPIIDNDVSAQNYIAGARPFDCVSSIKTKLAVLHQQIIDSTCKKQSPLVTSTWAGIVRITRVTRIVIEIEADYRKVTASTAVVKAPIASSELAGVSMRGRAPVPYEEMRIGSVPERPEIFSQPKLWSTKVSPAFRSR